MIPTELDMSTFEELKQMSGADFIDEFVDTFLEDAPKLIASSGPRLLSTTRSPSAVPRIR